MLTEKEYRLNTMCFERLSYFGIFPLEIHGFEMKSPGKKRLALWLLLLTAQVVHVIMALWLMLSKVTSVGQGAIPTLAMDYCVIVASLNGIFSAIQNFIRWPDVAQSLWKSVRVCDIDRCERKGGLWGYTYLEIYTMLLPFGTYPATFAVAIVYYIISIWPITVGFPVLVQLVLILPETLVLVSCMSYIHFGLIIHITFLEKVGVTIKTQMKNLQRQLDWNQVQGIQESVQKLRALQVEINAFNASQKNIIFAYRLSIICGVIFCGFAAIQFFHGDLIVGVCNVSVVIEAAFAFGFSYNKGFSIPRSIQALQRSLLFHVSLNRDVNKSQRMLLKRQIKSVGKMAVSVGNFHHLQRVSTPNFMDFSVKNMVRLVMFYRRHAA